MTKTDVRSAAGWVGVIVLSPLVGATVYMFAGINRIRRQALSRRRDRSQILQERAAAARRRSGKRPADPLSGLLPGIGLLGDRVTETTPTPGNRLTLLGDADEAYAAFGTAIDGATSTIWLESYIFDHDSIGLAIADRLIAASRRGVDVRVLVDAVGARYTIPSIVGYLRSGGIRTESFNGKIITGLRLPYANMRTHRKILIVDGRLAFTGGMNITDEYSRIVQGDEAYGDTHFALTGPAIEDLALVFAEDWLFATGEMLDLPQPEPQPGGVVVRVVASGPDIRLETNLKLLLGAISAARSKILIRSPYFLPDRDLIGALVTAGLRGVEIDIVVPDNNEFQLVDDAMTAQIDTLISANSRIWRALGPFNHSKLMTIDGVWSFTGSSNLDPRSLRLNFEVDLEVHDQAFAALIEARIREAIVNARPVTLESLAARPVWLKLLQRVLWLGSPYL